MSKKEKDENIDLKSIVSLLDKGYTVSFEPKEFINEKETYIIRIEGFQDKQKQQLIHEFSKESVEYYKFPFISLVIEKIKIKLKL